MTRISNEHHIMYWLLYFRLMLFNFAVDVVHQIILGVSKLIQGIIGQAYEQIQK